MRSPRETLGRRALRALVLILAVTYGVQLAASLVAPLAPALLVFVLLFGICHMALRRRQ